MVHRAASARRSVVLSMLATLTLLGACSSSSRRSGQSAGLVAQLSVERGLQAANERDLETMRNNFV